MRIVHAVRQSVSALRTDGSFDEIQSSAKEKRGAIEYVPAPRPLRIRRRSYQLSESVILSTLGECDVDNDSSLKHIYFEIIDPFVSEMDELF